MELTLRQVVSGILGFAVQDWDQAFKDAEVQGKLDKAKTNRILLELCKRIEKYEISIESSK